MNRGGIGAASIMLVFVVLCLVIFAVITLTPALTDQELVEAEVQMVQAFFAADTKAEQILAEILILDYVPQSIMGVDIIASWDWDASIEIVSFAVDINDTQLLFVEVGLDFDSYQIFSWQMVNVYEWNPYVEMNIWTIDDDYFWGW